jgi:predicted ester cyclase
MGCGDECPHIPGRRYIDWDLPDPKGRPIDEVRAIRDHIGRRVAELVSELDGAPNKLLVRRLVQEAVRERNLDVLGQIAAGEFAELARRWVRPFQSAFPDFEMEIVDLISEGEKVVAHFRCSGTHLGEWHGAPATGRRFENVDEIYIFGVHDGQLVSALGVEDNLSRLRQLGISPQTA